MRLFLVRHGQTTANRDLIFAGQTDVPLTEQGRRDALRIRPILENFSFDRVFGSDLSRAVETQKLALPSAEAEQTQLLREYDEGAFVGKNVEQAHRAFGTNYMITRDYSPYGGENSWDVCARLQKFLDTLEADPCENAVAFTHNGVLNCMLQIALGVDYDHRAVGNQNCAIHVFRFDGERWQLLAWNYMAPLDTGSQHGCDGGGQLGF